METIKTDAKNGEYIVHEPDPHTHFLISLGKSALRIAGCVSFLISGHALLFVIGILAAEVLGVLEELF